MKKVRPPIAIIGIHSFSGSSLAKHLLSNGENIIGFARSKEVDKTFLAFRNLNKDISDKCTVIQANLLNDAELIADTIRNNRVEIVLNFAAQSMVSESWISPSDWYDVNVSAFAKLVQNLSFSKPKHLQKFINFSTPEVYGNTEGSVSENWDFNPTTPYAISRAASDFHLRAFHSNFGFPVIFTRTSNIYGPHQKLYRMIPKLILKVKMNSKFELHGGGSSRRSFIHADDVSQALFRIIQDGEIGSTYHISTKEFISIFEIAQKVVTQLNGDFASCVNLVDERKGKDHAYLLNSDKIRLDLGWSDSITLGNGIEDVINWIERDWEILKNLPLEYIHSR